MVGVVGVTEVGGVSTGGVVTDVAAAVVPGELTPPPPHPDKTRQSAAADEAAVDKANFFMRNFVLNDGKRDDAWMFKRGADKHGTQQRAAPSQAVVMRRARSLPSHRTVERQLAKSFCRFAKRQVQHRVGKGDFFACAVDHYTSLYLAVFGVSAVKAQR